MAKDEFGKYVYYALLQLSVFVKQWHEQHLLAKTALFACKCPAPG
jgi:hypothetical protein